MIDDQGSATLRAPASGGGAGSAGTVDAVEVLCRHHDSLRLALDRVYDPSADRSAAWLAAVGQMATHVAVERTFVYPLVRRRRVGPVGLAAQLKGDYARMEKLLVRTERRKINSPDMPALVGEVVAAFRAHEDRCSAALVPAMQELGEAERVALGARMQAAGHVILSHPHPHLLALGPVYEWTTRLAGWWDRLRDRTVRNR